MSGGSHDYSYVYVERFAERLKNDNRSDRRAFATHLEKVAKAMHDIEWVDSGDYAEDGDVESIKACVTSHDMLKLLIIEAEYIKSELTGLLKQIKAKKT